jgi:hypothetical protein
LRQRDRAGQRRCLGYLQSLELNPRFRDPGNLCYGFSAAPVKDDDTLPNGGPDDIDAVMRLVLIKF